MTPEQYRKQLNTRHQGRPPKGAFFSLYIFQGSARGLFLCVFSPRSETVSRGKPQRGRNNSGPRQDIRKAPKRRHNAGSAPTSAHKRKDTSGNRCRYNQPTRTAAKADEAPRNDDGHRRTISAPETVRKRRAGNSDRGRSRHAGPDPPRADPGRHNAIKGEPQQCYKLVMTNR